VIGDPYISVAQLKSYIGHPDSEDDTEISDALDTVSRSIEDYCGRQFNRDTSVSPTASVRVFVPAGQHLIEPQDFYSTTGLVIKADYDGDGVYETTLTSYELSPLNGIKAGRTGWPYEEIRILDRCLPTRWWAGQRMATVEVTALWGWSAVPKPVAEACKIMAAETLKLKDSVFGVGGYSQFGVIKVRDNPFAANKLQPYILDAVLVA